MLVVLLLYAYCVGLPSSRMIEKACWEDAAFRVLTVNWGYPGFVDRSIGVTP